GRVAGIAVDPRDANIIYLGTAGGGAWKTIDGGKSWHPIFDAIPEIQTVAVGTTGTFTLSFNGSQPSATLSGTSPTLAADIQAALDGLSTVGGVGGLVTVVPSGSVTEVQQLTVTATSGNYTLTFGSGAGNTATLP